MLRSSSLRIAACCTFALLGGALVAQPLSPVEVKYPSFQAGELTRYAYKGRRVALLSPDKNLDPKLMARVVEPIDRGFDFCVKMTGRAPEATSDHNVEGRDTITSVPSTCGAGCGLFGRYGIELQDDHFSSLIGGVRDYGLWSDLPFYELGRNFWFYGDQTYGISDTGYAITTRFLALEASGAPGRPFRDQPTEVFRARVEELVDLYQADASCTFENTVLADRAPANPMNLGGKDLFASFLLRLRKLYGPKFLPRFFEELKKRPRTSSQQEGIDNLILAACSASGQDLSDAFTLDWRWPMSPSARGEARQMFAKPRAGGTGLHGDYFGDRDLKTLVGARVDPNVDFDWDFAWSPRPRGVGSPTNFSVRWTGRLKTRAAGAYTFTVDSDDGARLWVNGRPLVDEWHDKYGESSATIELPKDAFVLIKLEYYQATGGANVKLIWSGPGVHRQVIPQDRLFPS